MDYFDDLNHEAMAAFRELNDETDTTTLATILSPELRDLLHSTAQHHPPVQRQSNNMDYLFKLTSPLTPTLLASAAILPTQPVIITGSSESGAAQFCQISALDIPILEAWLAKTHPTISPIFAPINKAHKALSSSSAYPTLGLDTTLPHHRTACFLPIQSQYPVWYFFYGTLANASFLAELFSEPPGVLVPARICGGKLRTWGGKYNALVDSLGERVDGWAYEVISQEQEDILCMYETAKYEVVRVAITLSENEGRGRVLMGCTFRFAGEGHELD